MRGKLKNIDSADDLCLLSHKYNDIVIKLNALPEESCRVDLNINMTKLK